MLWTPNFLLQKCLKNFMFLQFIILDINMLFLPIICYQKRKLKKSAFWFSMTHHNQKRDLWHISRTIVPQQLVFMKIKGQQIKALFSTSKIWKQNWKIFFLTKCLAIWKYYINFLLHKNYWLQQNYWNLELLELIRIFYQKLTLCTNHSTEFPVSSISLSTDMTSRQKWSHPTDGPHPTTRTLNRTAQV